MVLRDEAHDGLRQALLARQLHAAGDVLVDHARALQRVEALVRRGLAGADVLDEEGRRDQLADVVVVGADADEQRIGADAVGGALGHVPHEDRVLERAGGLVLEAPEQRVVELRELHQLNARDDAERPAEQDECADGDQRGEHAADRGDAADPEQIDEAPIGVEQPEQPHRGRAPRPRTRRRPRGSAAGGRRAR